jgi:hypothetical protein
MDTYVRILPNSRIANSFWSKVSIGDSDECWFWTGALDRGGHGRPSYGRIHDGSKVTYAHRLSYEIANGEIPGRFSDGRKALIRHLCGNGLCVNPKHLALGNARDNMMDLYERKYSLKSI